MGDTKIEWAEKTWNPIRAELLIDILDKITGKVLHKVGEIGWFCIKCSPGCAGCYACSMNLWRGNGLEYTIPNREHVRMFLDEKTLLEPLKWRTPKMVFPCSMTDWMESSLVPDEWIEKILAVMALTPQHTYLSLTKRADRQRKYMAEDTRFSKVLDQASPLRAAIRKGFTETPNWPLPNLWLGVSVENPDYLKRFDDLLQTAASVRWGSLEPLLSDLGDLSPWLRISWQCSYCHNYFSGKLQMTCPRCGKNGGWTGSHSFNPKREHYTSRNDQTGSGIDWIVCGGESGPKARPMHPDWARSIRDQCKAAGVPFFFKQWGEWAPTKAKPIRGRYTGGGIFLRKDGYIASQGDWWDGNAEAMDKLGKKSSGRLLDGVEHNEYPKASR